MGHDPTEHAQEHLQHEAAHGHGPKWIMWAALTAALLAALAAVTSSLASKHLTQAMLTRIGANDKWAEYQSKSVKSSNIVTRTEVANAADPTRMADAAAVAKQQKSDKDKLAEYADKTKEDSMPTLSENATEMEHVSAEHLEAHETYELSATMFHIAIAVVAIAVVAKRKEFWFMSMVGGVFGIYFLGTAFSHAPTKHEHAVEPAGEHAATEAHAATGAAHDGGAPGHSPAATEHH